MPVAESEASTDVGGRNRQRHVDAPPVPCHIFLPVVPAARVIGKGGASIRAIREQSGATVRILQKELPDDMQKREDRVVAISGDTSAVHQAIGLVLERVFDRSGLPEGSDRSKDRAHIVEVLVPEKSGSHLIGQRGERIKSLIEETCCDLHVVKEPMAGLVDQKRVRVTANSAEEAKNAVWRLQVVLNELAAGGVLRPEHFELREAHSATASGFSSGSFSRPTNSSRETPIRLLFSKEEAAWIVGKKGNKITKLRDVAKVQMNDADSPPFDSSERVVEIATGKLEQRVRVVHMILDDLALRQEATNDLRLLVRTEQFGSVMGHRGETIRGIMQSTGANLQQHKADKTEDGGDYHLRLVEIRGDIRQRVEVVRLVHLAIESRGRDPLVSSGSNAADSRLDLSFNGGLGMDAPSLGAVGQPAYGSSPMAPGLLGDLGGAMDHITGAAGGYPGNGGGSAAGATEVSLQLAMPNEEVARLLANDSSGIAWRAGVKLSVGRGAGGIPILQVVGTAVGNSVACYLVQDRLFMMH